MLINFEKITRFTENGATKHKGETPHSASFVGAMLDKGGVSPAKPLWALDWKRQQMPGRVIVATDPWPFGEAPINCYHTFAALISEARPALEWSEHSVLVSDEGSTRQVEAEYTFWREARRVLTDIGPDPIVTTMTAEERLDLAGAMLREHFKVAYAR